MYIKQISVFLENRKGRLQQVTDILARNQINIRALSLADTAEFGVLRMIVNDPDKSLLVLKQQGFIVKETDVIGIEVEDKPGGLNSLLKILSNNDINVEYMYAFVEKRKDNAIVVIRVDDMASTVKLLKEENVTLINQNEIK